MKQDDYTVGVLRERFTAEGSIDGFYSCFYFEERGVFQKLVHSLKYDAVTVFGVELGRYVGELLWDNINVEAVDAIVPIPLHRLKQRERGYNQSEFICRGISSILYKPVLPALVRRSKETVSQTHLTAEERKMNVGDAFDISLKEKQFVRGKTFVIVDDVITTGSTIQAVARVLKHTGAKRVIAASAALAKLG
ncbi:MAG TPA: phosphoribosyltransferase family protein [Bacteroidota bacterium]|nr:phosphoribosyltransferase family protein [Bacteroidota bacterium]